MKSLDRAGLARMIDHTLLTPEAVEHDVLTLCATATELGVAAVCVSPHWVSLAAAHTDLPIASVAGFPSGSHLSKVKAEEAAQAVNDGAREIDVVANLGFIASANWQALQNETAEVRLAIGEKIVLKVILETALWSERQIMSACSAVVAGGANFVKTSTGFHKSGGATVDAVRTMRLAVGGGIGVKASGGIRTTRVALEMIKAGANRIGASASREILGGLT
ncbi:MAG: deoxyribose-phosphate aldolase [Ilumatobacteraceae bacterium]|jgi:deoxyribose-phosphate aldolase